MKMVQFFFSKAEIVWTLKSCFHFSSYSGSFLSSIHSRFPFSKGGKRKPEMEMVQFFFFLKAEIVWTLKSCFGFTSYPDSFLQEAPMLKKFAYVPHLPP